MSSASAVIHSRRCFLLGLVASTASGCAHWLPSRKEPEPRKSTILSQELAPDTVGIESILLRLSSVESQQMPDLWAYADEQVLAPEPRMLLDRNGLRAGKFSGQIPAIVQAWVAQNATRIEQDPMEQAGVVADVSSFSQLWRCRPDQRKVLTVRNLPKETVTLFYNEEGFRGGSSLPHTFSSRCMPSPTGLNRRRCFCGLRWSTVKPAAVWWPRTRRYGPRSAERHFGGNPCR